VKAFLEFVGKLWPLIAMIGLLGTSIVGVSWYVFTLDRRIGTLEERAHTLEERVHTLTVAPVIAKFGEKNSSVNPVAQACADLARQKAVTSDTDPFSASSEQIRSAMADLGCSAPH
jgi:hypothetical protein